MSHVDVVSKENLEMAVNTTLLKEFEDKIDELIKIKNIVQHEPCEYDRTLVSLGVRHNHDDDPMELATKLLHGGLRLTYLMPVRAIRIRNESKGIFKVELYLQEDKILALKNSANLKHYHELGNKVTVRSSTNFENRVTQSNFRFLMDKLGLQRECVMNKHGQIVPRIIQYHRGIPQGRIQEFPLGGRKPLLDGSPTSDTGTFR